MKNQERFFNIMREIYTYAPTMAMALYVNEYVNTGLMLQLDISNIISSRDLEGYKKDIVTLVRMYSPFSGKRIKLQNEYVDMPSKYEFFSNDEIAEASFSTEAMQNALPVTLKKLATLRPNNFITVLSIREIMALKTAGLIQWKSEMQREQVTDGTVSGKLISHIKFQPERSKEIGALIASNTFYPNTLRWHVIASDCEYDNNQSDIFVLKSGYFAEIDGQHRNKAIEYAIAENPSAELTFPIIVSIGDVKTAQYIINQDEKRAPLSKDKVESYSNSFGRAVTDKIINLNLLHENINFITKAVEDIDAIKGEMIRAIDEYYNIKLLNETFITYVAEWITDFINYEDDFRCKYILKTKKTPKIEFKLEYIRAYILLSSFWKQELIDDNLDLEEAHKQLNVIWSSIYKSPKDAQTLANKIVMRSYVAACKTK